MAEPPFWNSYRMLCWCSLRSFIISSDVHVDEWMLWCEHFFLRSSHRQNLSGIALPPFFRSPEAGVVGLLLCRHSLDHLEFSASFASGGLDAPPELGR